MRRFRRVPLDRIGFVSANSVAVLLWAWLCVTHLRLRDRGPDITRAGVAAHTLAIAFGGFAFAHPRIARCRTTLARSAAFAGFFALMGLLLAASILIRALAPGPFKAAQALFGLAYLVALVGVHGLPLLIGLLYVNVLAGPLLGPAGEPTDWLGRAARASRGPVLALAALLGGAWAMLPWWPAPEIPCSALFQYGAREGSGRCVVPRDLDLKDYDRPARLPDRLTVQGTLSLFGCTVDRLPRALVVTGDLWLYKSCIDALPPDLVVGGDVESYVGFGNDLLLCRDVPKSVQVRGHVRCED